MMRPALDYMNHGSMDYQRYWQDVSDELGVDRNTLICGYARQPITILPAGDTVTVRSVCSLDKKVCNHNVEEGEKFNVTNCGRYETFFEHYKPPNHGSEKR